MQMTINPLNFLIKENESGFRYKQMSHVHIAWETAQKPLHFVRRGRILLRCGSASRVTAALLGRFLPRLGPLLHQKRPFFLSVLFSVERACWCKAKHVRARSART